jgi:DNA-binding NarL/FixJ family response regulator
VDRPLIVLEGPEGVADALLERLRAAGWQIVEGFPAGRASGVVMCHGRVETRDDAAAALLAALHGHGLVVESRAATAVLDALVDDLRHLGPVDHRGAEGSPGTVAAAPHGAISPQARALLALLAEGLTLGEAAAHLGMSRRTADRRLAEARRALSAERTTEAVARARRLGWLDARTE